VSGISCQVPIKAKSISVRIKLWLTDTHHLKHTQKASLRIHGSKTEGEMKLKVEKGATNSMREEWYRGMV